MRHPIIATLVLLGLVLGPVFGLLGCEARTKVIRSRPWLAGLPGAVGGEQIVDTTTTTQSAPDEEIVIENADGSKTLVAHNGRHLMIHVYTCLRDKDRALFAKQVLSTLTKQDFIKKGKDPEQALDMLLAQQDDIVDLLNAMPYAEHTPGLFLENQGKRVFRVRLYGPESRGLRLVGIDMVMEAGSWKLRWFVPDGAK